MFKLFHKRRCAQEKVKSRVANSELQTRCRTGAVIRQTQSEREREDEREGDDKK